jgi:predicted outer membrane repeat protein
MCRMMLTIAVLCALTLTVSAQQPPASPTFDVVSVKRNTGQEQGGAISPVGSQFRTFNIPLRIIITYAYNVRDLELVGRTGMDKC